MKGSISTHVLDTGAGHPARGIRVELYRDARLLSAQETNEDGRIADLARGAVEPGTYRLVFHVGAGFFRRVEVEFAVADATRHTHVPLLISPYACTTYRGS